MTEDEIIRLGMSAEGVLSSEAYNVAMKELEAALVEKWANGEITTSQEREEAYGLVRGARTFRARLEAMLGNMKISKAQAEQRIHLRR